MAPVLLLCGIVFIVCILSNKLSTKIGVPALLLFILLGMLCGSDGLFKIQFSDYHITDQICSVALIFIMFYGGFGTNWKVARPVAPQAILLSSLGVVITAALTGLFCHYVLRMTLLEGLLIGAVISSTDAASVFSILRSKKLNLKHGLASMLEIESGSNDPTAYMLTVIILALMTPGGDTPYAYLIFAQVAYGLLFGFGLAFAAVFVLKRVRLGNSALHMIFMVGIALVAYALPTLIGGNGYLSVYITGIVLGNSKIRHKVELAHFFDGFTWIMQIALFFIIGLLSFPSQIPQILLPAIAIALFMTFISRPIAVFSILTPFRTPLKQQTLVAWSGLRGAASIVFAIYAVVSNAYTSNDIFHIVFCVALLSVAIQGTLLPLLARRLGLVDDSDTVLKTFTDYQSLSQMQLIDIPIVEGHPWTGHKIKDLGLPGGILIIMIRRRGKSLIPKGDTTIKADDVLVLSATPFAGEDDYVLSEEYITKKHHWYFQPVKNIKLPDGSFVLMIKRDNYELVPSKDTVVLSGDTLVISDEAQSAPPPKRMRIKKKK